MAHGRRQLFSCGQAHLYAVPQHVGLGLWALDWVVGRFRPRRDGAMHDTANGLRRILLLETVWKLRKGSDTWSHEPAERDQRAPFRTFRATKNRAIRPAQRVSRQSLEGVFSEVQVRE